MSAINYFFIILGILLMIVSLGVFMFPIYMAIANANILWLLAYLGPIEIPAIILFVLGFGSVRAGIESL